jgi:type IV secretory pathway VirB2 component (pilin)
VDSLHHNLKYKMKSSKQIKIILANLIVLSIFIFPLVTLAQGTVTPPPPPGTTGQITINNPAKCGASCDTLMGLLVAILNNIVMPIAAVAVVMWIIWAGFSYLTAQGNPKKVEEAHKRLLWSLIGAGILLGAAAIAKVVETTVTALTTP